MATRVHDSGAGPAGETARYFQRLFDFVEGALDAGENVLIHCSHVVPEQLAWRVSYVREWITRRQPRLRSTRPAISPISGFSAACGARVHEGYPQGRR